jgi:hypothetical protein
VRWLAGRPPPPGGPASGNWVQIDGSDHAWFEDRGRRCTLLVYVDDATSRLMELCFAAAESTSAPPAATSSATANPWPSTTIGPGSRPQISRTDHQFLDYSVLTSRDC